MPALERSWNTSGALRIEDSTILVILSGIFKVPLLTLQVLVSKPISGLRDNPRRFASLTPPLDSPRGCLSARRIRRSVHGTRSSCSADVEYRAVVQSVDLAGSCCGTLRPPLSRR